MSARFVVGIDLGTTNSALAYVPLTAEGDLAEKIRVLKVPQLVAPGEVAARPLLPSNAYLPAEAELPPGAMKLPWGEPRETPVALVGEFAKLQGAKVPGRMVSSAKSWLCHPRVDRLAPILPWGAPEGVPKLSPVAASARYLAHLKAAWEHAHPDAPLGEQEVMLTVPASFDEVARELTLRAAREAGLEKLVLIEEPQAAFYDWTRRHRGNLGEVLGQSRLVLICDVGGGTTDLTLIHVSAGAPGTPPVLKRIAVGEHLLLGGDNMDVTLARRVEARLGARLDVAQWSSLVQACRLAKEAVLSPGGPAKASVSVVGRGSRLIGSTLSAELSRDEVMSTLLDGFFPFVRADEQPARAARTALQELGLPYAAEPAVTRHVAAFLKSHQAEIEVALGAGAALRPDVILLNGGVFTPVEVGERLRQVVQQWFPNAPGIGLLESDALDVAVARGAAYYGLVRKGLGLRIGGGSARAYFVGIDTPAGKQALCVVPRELEEATTVDLLRPFTLTLDRPVRFALHASTLAVGVKAGDVVPMTEDLQELPPIETVLRSGGPSASSGRTVGASKAVEVPVRLQAGLTEIGTLELWCVATDRDARWKLEFSLRGQASDEGPTAVAPMPKRFAEAKELVDLVFGKKPVPVEKKDVKSLFKRLEGVLGPREGWSTPACRELWASLHAGMGKRRRTADHERLWFQLTGFTLRPGFGAPLDGWRTSETWKVFEQGIQFQTEANTWAAWWILWRRIAGGLDASAQQRLFDTVAPFVKPLAPGKTAPKPRGVKGEAVDEMVRLLASLERVDAERKTQAGGWLLHRLAQPDAAPYLLWAVGRLGARVPFHGSANTVVPPKVAEEWLSGLLARTERSEELAFALVQLARVSGDRARDLDEAVRRAVRDRLVAMKTPPERVRLVEELVELSEAEETRIFGEALPAGLKLVEQA